MSLGFISSRKKGIHYDLAKFAVSKLKEVNLLLKGTSERNYEHTVISLLQASPRLRKNIITQIGEEEVEKITQANLFGFKHRPDTTIGKDGTAIEIKVVTGSQSVREILGQAIAYRMHYKFVILVLIDNTPERHIVDLCSNKTTQEFALLSGLADTLNIFSIVGPKKQNENITFYS
ncbi:MAG: hypothetical protein HY753_09175 [Nitrospirae bacterium]|nr:hypothetical protein [Nitrospirota bacterium]